MAELKHCFQFADKVDCSSVPLQPMLANTDSIIMAIWLVPVLHSSHRDQKPREPRNMAAGRKISDASE